MNNLTNLIHSALEKLKYSVAPTVAAKPTSWCNFSIVHGKITPPLSCELNAVDHCNISCLDCNHAAPGVKPSIADPNEVYKDFSQLAQVYQAKRVKILGGEPLLHPHLPELIHAVRTSGIAKEIVLVTNGTLLNRINDAVLQAIDRIEISSYPEISLNEAQIQLLQKKAKQHCVIIDRFFYHQFRATFSTVGTTDKHLVRRIFHTCKLSRLWGCQSVHEGFFYKCPQCIYIHKIIGKKMPYTHRMDGIKIEESQSFFEKIVQYLSLHEPLQACRYCLGSVGTHRPHRQVNKNEWKIIHTKQTEKLIDYSKLRDIELGLDVPDINRISVPID